ncbi:hypothetical protein ACFSJ3_04830 [Corallincola platygyrae]|uniref:Uncharacterized protein n=1 Tax=Corallincola platygyrae TaxID=1193278 RepID=A0ABW4XIE7_9GAMM
MERVENRNAGLATSYLVALFGLLLSACSTTPEHATLADAEYHPYGSFVGKQGDRELHHKWNMVDPMLHYIWLAEKTSKLPADIDKRDYQYTSKALALSVADNQFTIDSNEPWLVAEYGKWDDRFMQNFFRRHNRMLSGVAILGWRDTTASNSGDPQVMVVHGFEKALSRTERLINELGMNCHIQGYAEETQYDQAKPYVEHYLGVHRWRNYRCGKVFVNVMTSARPDLAATYSMIRVRSDDEKGSHFPEIALAYDQFKQWNIADASAGKSYATEEYVELVDTWVNGKERTFPVLRRHCPCSYPVN